MSLIIILNEKDFFEHCKIGYILRPSNFSIECHAGCIEDHVRRIVLGEFSGAYIRFDAPFR